MLKEIGTVIAYQKGIATIKCQTKSGCGSCASRSACGTSALSELTGEKTTKDDNLFTVESIIPLKIGQKVEIGLSEKSLLISTLLLYALPLFTILLTTLIGQAYFKSEFITLFFIVINTMLSFIFIRFYAKKLQVKPQYQPVLLKAF